MDEIGAMSAMRAAGETCVTAKINGLDFKRPVPQGDTCIVESYVYAVGRTSLRTRIRAYRESPRTGERELTTESYFVFVSVDADGTPTPVPELTVEGTAAGSSATPRSLPSPTRSAEVSNPRVPESRPRGRARAATRRVRRCRP